MTKKEHDFHLNMIIVDECSCIFRRDASERFVNQEYDFKLNTLFNFQPVQLFHVIRCRFPIFKTTYNTACPVLYRL